MTQEEKNLLLQDLCARISYGVKAILSEYHIDEFPYNGTYCDKVINLGICEGTINLLNHIEKYGVKPYLRPMSSMTEEEKRHISKMMCLRTYDDGVVHDMAYPVYTPYYVMEDCLSYLRSIHMDYSGLIEKGLALEASEGMYKEWISIRDNLKEDKEGNIVGGLKL